MSLFRIPKGVKRRLEKIQRDFWWGGDNLDKKVHLINWGTICSSMEKGGLGICSLTKLNKSLLGKWNWRLAVEDNPPWKRLIKVKYGLEKGNWHLKEPKGRFGVGVWKEIRREAQLMKQDCNFILGDGGRIRFWEDKWCGSNTLCDLYFMLYALANSKGA